MANSASILHVICFLQNPKIPSSERENFFVNFAASIQLFECDPSKCIKTVDGNTATDHSEFSMTAMRKVPTDTSFNLSHYILHIQLGGAGLVAALWCKLKGKRWDFLVGQFIWYRQCVEAFTVNVLDEAKRLYSVFRFWTDVTESSFINEMLEFWGWGGALSCAFLPVPPFEILSLVQKLIVMFCLI